MIRLLSYCVRILIRLLVIMNSTRHGRMGKQCLTFTAHSREGHQAATRSNPIMSRAVPVQQQTKPNEKIAGESTNQICCVFICMCPGRPQGPYRYLLIWYKFIRIDRDLSLLLTVSSNSKIFPMCRAVGSSVLPPVYLQPSPSSGMDWDCTWCPKKKLSAAPNTQTCCRSFLSSLSFLFFSFLSWNKNSNNQLYLASIITVCLVLINRWH